MDYETKYGQRQYSSYDAVVAYVRTDPDRISMPNRKATFMMNSPVYAQLKDSMRSFSDVERQHFEYMRGDNYGPFEPPRPRMPQPQEPPGGRGGRGGGGGSGGGGGAPPDEMMGPPHNLHQTYSSLVLIHEHRPWLSMEFNLQHHHLHPRRLLVRSVKWQITLHRAPLQQLEV